MAYRKERKPYILRQHIGKTTKKGTPIPIDVEFRHMPGRRISLGTTDLREAILRAEEILHDEGLLLDVNVPSFRDIAEDFFLKTGRGSQQEWDIAHERSYYDPQYYKTRQGLVDNYLIPRFGHTLINAINSKQIDSWLVSFEGRYKQKRLSSDTKNRALSCMSKIMEYARREGYIDHNPCKDVQQMTTHQNSRRALTIAEQQAMFPLSADERISIWGSLMWATYFSVMYDTGFRPGEVSGLKTEYFYISPQGLSVATKSSINSHEKKEVKRIKTTGKGMSKKISVIDGTTAQLVVRLFREENLGYGQLLFLLNRNDPESFIVNSTSNKHFKGVYKKQMGYPVPKGVVQYCIRHTKQTYMEGNVDDPILALTMGHTRIRDDYDHRDDIMLIGQMEKSREDIFAGRDRLNKEAEIKPLLQRLKKA